MRARKIPLVYIFLVSLIAGVSASVPPAFIRSASGSGISVYRNGMQQRLQPDNNNLHGFPLYSGDIIQTDRGATTLVQINQDPRGLIMIDENSTLELQSDANSGLMRVNLSTGTLVLRSEGTEEPLEVILGSSSLQLSDALVHLSYGPRNINGFIAVIAEVSMIEGYALIRSFADMVDETSELVDTIPLEGMKAYTIDLSDEYITVIRETESGDLSEHYQNYRSFSPVSVQSAFRSYSLLDYHPLAQDDLLAVPLRSLPRLQYRPEIASITALPAAQRSNIEVEPRQRYFVPNRALQITGVSIFSAGAIVELAAVSLMLFGQAYASDLIEQDDQHIWGTRLLIAGGITMGIGTGLYFIGF